MSNLVSEDSSAATTEELLRDKDDTIGMLKRQKGKQDEAILQLQQELGEAEIRHKEEVYWLRLEVDGLRREKEGIEDRVAELYRELKEIEAEADIQEQPQSLDAEYVMSLQQQVGKYARAYGVLETQVSMVKQSCDEVVKSLKEEIADVIDDKTRMEMDLLNQLAVLDNEKRELEMDFEEQIKMKDDKIGDLKKGIGVVTGGKGKEKEEDYINQISDLKDAKRRLEDELQAERNESDDAIARLEDANVDLENQIESMTSDLAVMRQGAAAEAVQVLDALTRDRQETLTTLERVAMIWEKADDSIQGLEDVMDELRPNDDDPIQGDRERLLSTLETASLVHGQIKVSLLLVELKLRNQLSSLKNDKLRMGTGSIAPDQNLTERMKEIQQEALTALDQVEDSLTDQIKQLENLTREETAQVKDDLQEKTDELRVLQGQHKKFESEISRLRKQEEERKSKDSDDKPQENENGKMETAVSKAVLERLQNEVLTVVERIRDKNETIGRLTTSIEEHKMREGALKKELKRMMKRSRGTEEDSGGLSGTTARQSRRSSTRPDM
jgi:chromosome segregation ATPase